MRTIASILALTLALSVGTTPAGAQDIPRSQEAIGPAAGTGPYPAIAQAVADAPGYTLYRPAELPGEPLPVVVWGNGACRNNGLSASHFLREIASHGYIVIANGAPGEERPPRLTWEARPPEAAPPAPPATPPVRRADETSVEQFLGALDWAARAHDGAGPLRGHIDTSRAAAMGHSCGGLQALAASADPRIDTVIAFASGVYNQPSSGPSGVGIDKDALKRLHTPVAYILGGPQDIAFPNGSDDFARIDHVPVMLANQPVGHGGTFDVANGGDWARVGTAWLDWQLKGDARAAKWFVGPGCILCTTFGWTVERKQFPELP
jgi:dienelactone hydrolase